MSEHDAMADNKNNRVGIAGLWYGKDYGSILMPYALYKAVENMGFEPVLFDKPSGMWDDSFLNRESAARKFMESRCDIMTVDDIDAVNAAVDTFIVGPDVVWDWAICGRGAGTHFFLDFVEPCKKKIAYCSSLARSWNESPRTYRSSALAWIETMDNVYPASMEDKEQLECYGITCGRTVCNPILLLDAATWKEVASSSDAEYPEEYIFADVSVPSELKTKAINILAKENEKEVALFKNLNINADSYESVGMHPTKNDSVADWVRGIADCSFAIVDSLYGVCMAIALDKPFVVLMNARTPMFEQIVHTLNMYGCSDNIVPICCIHEKHESYAISVRGRCEMKTHKDKDYSLLSDDLLRKVLMSDKPNLPGAALTQKLYDENRTLKRELAELRSALNGISDMVYMQSAKLDVQGKALVRSNRLAKGLRYLRNNGMKSTIARLIGSTDEEYAPRGADGDSCEV